MFPESIRPYLKVVTSLGLVLFMFIVGMEVDLDVACAASGKRAVAISLTSIALPFALGFMMLGPLLHDEQQLCRGGGGHDRRQHGGAGGLHSNT